MNSLSTEKNIKKQAVRLVKSMLIRSKSNAHRYVYFLNGKLRTFTTTIGDINGQLASLFGALNQFAPTVAAQLLLLAVGMAALQGDAHAANPSFSSTVSGTGTFSAGSGNNAGTYNQTSNVAIAQWNSFDVDANKHIFH